MSMQNIIDTLKTTLYAATGAGAVNATDALNSRIYPIEGKPNAAFPHMTFEITNCDVQQAMGGVVSYDMTVRFDVWTNKELGTDAAMDIEAKLFTLLEGSSLAPSGFDRALCTFNRRCDQIVDEDSIRISDELRIRATDF